jgi:hypothetical protein
MGNVNECVIECDFSIYRINISCMGLITTARNNASVLCYLLTNLESISAMALIYNTKKSICGMGSSRTACNNESMLCDLSTTACKRASLYA